MKKPKVNNCPNTFKYIALVLLFIAGLPVSAQWKPAGDRIKTQWAEKVDPNQPLKEYPRPIMKRDDWKNLNGLWDYSIQPAGSMQPTNYDGKILVPFPIESSLSGVMKEVGGENELWYSTTFSVPGNWGKKDILLHFGAVDWRTDVWLNGVKIGSHEGGFDPFSFNITPFLNGKNATLTLRVWDPTSDAEQPRGKQQNKPEGIYYTPVTGIWQTVWLEPVSKNHIENLKITPDIDNNRVKIMTETSALAFGDIVEVTVYDGTNELTKVKAAAGEELEIPVMDAKLWSPENPFLFDITVKLLQNGKSSDEVKSYFAMRKISTERDDKGIVRIQLNNRDYFEFGPLDQGWWPDGLYTAPTDEALKYDIEKTKELGFNMIRKHVKVEPARWYTHCDQMGVLVWQDMPSSTGGNGWNRMTYHTGNEWERPAKSEKIFRKEWKAIMDYLYSYPSIVVWVPFNEAWGQFKTKEITEWTENYDPSRLVNSASGGNHFQVGDILDLHNYPNPSLYLYDANRATVLGEYGGIGLPLEGHLWKTGDNWGYIQFKSSDEVTNEYVKYAKQLEDLVKAGFSAAVYTQTTDVEGEVNGFMTYDRKVDKLDIPKARKANEEVIDVLNN